MSPQLDYEQALTPYWWNPIGNRLAFAPYGSTEADFISDVLPGWRQVKPRDLASELDHTLWEPPTLRAYAKYIDPLAAAEDYSLSLGDAYGTITAVTFYPAAPVTGVVTNTRTWALESVDADTTFASLTLGAGVVLPQGDPCDLTVATSAIQTSDGLVWTSTHAGTGLPDPGGLLLVTANGPS